MDSELELLADPHREPGYFSIEGLELSKAECLTLDALVFLIFTAAHGLVPHGRLPKTIQGLTAEQVGVLRQSAVSMAASVLVAEANGRLPLSVSVSPGASTFAVRSHRGQREIGPQGPSTSPRGG
jgi:hypothetical protein